MGNNYYVYVWYIVDTNEVFYVGKGKGDRYKNIYNRNKFFKNIYDTHICEPAIIYDNLSENEAFIKEIDMIKYYRENYPNYRLTNQTDGGEGSSGWKASEEFKLKQSITHKKQWEDSFFREKMIKIRTDENGIYKSQEFRRKISSIVKGVNNPNYNNRWNDSQKNHLSKVRKELGLAKGSNNPNSKSILCVETGETFKYITLALDKYGVKNETSMSTALNCMSKTCAGLHWVDIINHEEMVKSQCKRNEYLLRCYSSSLKWNPIVDLVNNVIFKNKKDMMLYLDVGKKIVNKLLKTESDRYVELKQYYESHI